jgi:hypothetical protein
VNGRLGGLGQAFAPAPQDHERLLLRTSVQPIGHEAGAPIRLRLRLHPSPGWRQVRI